MSTVAEARASSGGQVHVDEALAIRSEGLTKRFGSRTALADVALRIPRGCTYGLIGLNGAGKSTLIRLIMGLTPPTERERGDPRTQVAGDSWRTRIGVGYVPDRCVVHGWMRVGEAIRYCRRLQPTWNQERCAELLAKFRLDESQKVRRLSKGTAAKLSLLLALSHDPEILILDEPTDGLDPVAREDFLEGVLASACEEGRTVLMSSHNLDDVQRLADHIGLIHAGRLVIQCETEELVRTTRRVHLVVEPGKAVSSLPGNVIMNRREGREWRLTVRGFEAGRMEEFAREVEASVMEVEEITLDEVFKDFVRGREDRR